MGKALLSGKQRGFGINQRGMPKGWFWLVLIGLLSASNILRAGDFPEPTHLVGFEEVLAAMQKEADLGYNLLVSTTSTRFASSVILDLVKAAEQTRPNGEPLLLHYDDWCEAFRQVNHLDSGSLPEFVALQRIYKQSQYVDYATDQRRITIKDGPTPLRVVKVSAGWPHTAGSAAEYSFIDSASSPRMQAINERVIYYWLVEFDDMVMQDKVEGLKGRPLDGALGTLFKVIGNGRAVQSRFAISDDGIQVTQARAKKGFLSVNPTSTTFPDGLVEKGTPKNRPDLEALAKRLQRKIRIEYPDP
jgi:hypothetical protein